jgi:hypothetical protein
MKQFLIKCYDKGYEAAVVSQALGLEYFIEIYIPMQFKLIMRK